MPSFKMFYCVRFGETNLSFNLPSCLCRVPPQFEGTRRKNASRKATGILKEWLNNHKNNPYPTKAQKSELAAATGMNVSQVGNFFNIKFMEK